MENRIEKLKEEFAKIKKEMSGISYIKKGSVTKCYQVCRNPNCRCHKDEKFRHGPYFLLTSKEKAKTKTISVPEQMLAEVREYIDNFQLLKSKFKRMEEITEELIKMKIKDYRKEMPRQEG
jgi:hypothetical protein